jgi:AcrR family transcriptional regulator
LYVLPLATLPAQTITGGLRERKKSQSRAAIADAALAMFAERGFEATTVADVAKQAGVSPATVARYFPSKESLLFPERDVNTASIRSAILARPARENPYTAVTNALSAAMPLDPPGSRRLLLSRQAIARSPLLRGQASTLLDTWRETIADAAIARGAAPSDARVLATIVVAVLDDVADRWALAGGETELAHDVAEAFAALARTQRRSS